MKNPTMKEKLEAALDTIGDKESEIQDLKRAKNRLVEEKASLERTVSQQVQELENHAALLRDIQRDMRTVCEAVYGQDFNPEWKGDRPMNIYQDGQEYAPVSNGCVTAGPPEYVDPMQRLIRMVWRRCFWGLHPLISSSYGESPR